MKKWGGQLDIRPPHSKNWGGRVPPIPPRIDAPALKANPGNKSKCGNDHKHSAKGDENCEQVENEQSTYTALKRTGNEDKDDHVYCHLNEVRKDNVNHAETTAGHFVDAVQNNSRLIQSRKKMTGFFVTK